MGPGPYFPVGTEIPVIWTIFPGFNGQTAPNRRAAMAEHAAGGRTRSPTGLLHPSRDLHFDSPTLEKILFRNGDLIRFCLGGGGRCRRKGGMGGQDGFWAGSDAR